MKGKPFSLEHRAAIKISQNRPEVKLKKSVGLKKHKRTKAHNDAISAGKKEKTFSEKHKLNLSKVQKVVQNLPEVKLRKSKFTKQQWEDLNFRENMTGENNPAYVHGESCNPYPLEFNEQLKEFIHVRDNRVC